MSIKHLSQQCLMMSLMCCLLTNCYRPPYNNFRPDYPTARKSSQIAGVGAATGLVATSTLSGTVVGGVAGGLIGGAVGLAKNTKKAIVRDLQHSSIQYVQYGDTVTLIVPTDKYFMFNSPRLNERNYAGLESIVKMINLYPKTPIYVAAFTDNVGSKAHKRKMSQAQAETMMSYLWAKGIDSQRLKAEGYGDKNPIADNDIIHGSAMNRRIEIQWESQPLNRSAVKPARYAMSK